MNSSFTKKPNKRKKEDRWKILIFQFAAAFLSIYNISISYLDLYSILFFTIYLTQIVGIYI